MPLRDELVDEVPHRDPAARVEPGGRLVEEQHRRATDEAHRDVEPTPHAARVRARDPVGGAGEVEALEQLAGARARASLRDWWNSRPTCSRFSKPVRRSSTAAY